MKKRILLAAGMAVPLAATAANAMSGACENFVNTVTGSSSQAFWYAACSAVMGAWEMFYEFF